MKTKNFSFLFSLVTKKSADELNIKIKTAYCFYHNLRLLHPLIQQVISCRISTFEVKFQYLMKRILFLLIILLTAVCSKAQHIYSKAYGNSSNQPVIFLHGGPGSNSISFELTTAQRLADKGFYVIVYDRRGEGRSIDPKAKFNLKQTFDDLNAIYKQYGIKKANLIAFSFGGLIAAPFAEKYPHKVKSLTLACSLISLQETYLNITERCRELYTQRNDSANLQAIAQIEQMDKTSIEYRDACSGHAFCNGFFSTDSLTQDAKYLYNLMETDSTYIKYSALKTSKPGLGFWKNEKYTTMDTSPMLEKMKEGGIPIFAIYGKDDGLFSKTQVDAVGKTAGNDRLKYLNNCSHYPFLDQQSEFVDIISRWLNRL